MKTQIRPAASPRRKDVNALRFAVPAGVLLVVILGALAAWWFTRESAGYTLVIEKPTGGTLRGRYISCGTSGSSCGGTRDRGEVIELRPSPDDGYLFAAYTGDCGADGRVAMDGPRTCGARFDPVAGGTTVRWRLTIDPPDGGTIISDVGHECGVGGSNCSVDVADRTEVRLDAYAAEGYAWQQYTGDCAPNGMTTMTAARVCGAVFARGAPPPPAPFPPASVAGPVRPPEVRPGAGTGSGPGSGPASGSGAGTAAGGGETAGTATVPVAPAPPPPGRADVGAQIPGTVSDAPGPAGPSGPAKSPTEIAHLEITTVLNAYRDAYSRMAVNDMQALHPKMPMRRFQAAFKDLKSVAYSFAEPPEFSDLDLRAGKVKAVAGVTIEMDHKAGDKQKPSKLKATFLLNRVGETARWIIEDITYQQ